MTKGEKAKFRARLLELAERIQGTADSAKEQACQATGGEAAGGLSNAPIHLGDIGSEALAQEIGATLLANEQFLQAEILDALDRVEKGTYGRCENCGRMIARERLTAIPYARHCVACAEGLHAGRAVNLDEGRPESWDAGIGLRAEGPPPGAPGGPEEEGSAGGDPHAAGTPGGGTAVGGLAGTNVAAGEPEGADLEGAMGSSAFDVAIETEPAAGEPPADVEAAGYSGHAGGAVGGTPANKRATGGRIGPGGR